MITQIDYEEYIFDKCFQDSEYLQNNFNQFQIDWNYLIILMIDNNNYKNKNIQSNLLVIFTLFKKKKITIDLKELKQLVQLAKKNNGISYYLDMEKTFPQIKNMKRYVVRWYILGF